MAKGNRSVLRPLYIVVGVTLLIVLGAITFIIAYGGTGQVDEGIPAVGIDVIEAPFSVAGQESTSIRWIVRGGEGTTGIYFDASPGVNTSAFFIPGQEVKLPNGDTVSEAELPNTYPLHHVRIYAEIDGTAYWSDEFEVHG